MNTIDKKDSNTGFFAYYFYETWFKNYSNHKQGISRKQYWMGALVMNLFLCVGLGGLSAIIGTIEWTLEMYDYPISMIFFVLFCIGYFIASIMGISMIVRRLRDLNKGIAWIFIGAIPLIGWIWLFILMCQPGQNVCLNPKNNQLDKKIWTFLALMFLLSVSCFIYTMS